MFTRIVGEIGVVQATFCGHLLQVVRSDSEGTNFLVRVQSYTFFQLPIRWHRWGDYELMKVAVDWTISLEGSAYSCWSTCCRNWLKALEASCYTPQLECNQTGRTSTCCGRIARYDNPFFEVCLLLKAALMRGPTPFEG